MSIIAEQDVAYYNIGDDRVHPECVTTDDEISEDEVVLVDNARDEHADQIVFCDRCKKTIRF